MHPRSRVLSCSLFCLALMLLVVPSGDLITRRADGAAIRDPSSEVAAQQRIQEQYGRLPLTFEKNEGQTDPRVEFLSRGMGYALFLSAGGEAVFALSGTTGESESARARRSSVVATHRPSVKETGAVLRLKLVGGRVDAHAAGREPLPGAVNYLRGTDRTRWRTGIQAYARVAYENVYPGVDLVYYGNQRQLEYDFIVRPGTDPDVIRFEAEGADHIEVEEGGDLVIHVGTREVRQQKPLLYQERQGVRHAVDGRYVLEGSRRVAFQVGAYDPALALVIDPVLVFSTYLGGTFTTGGEDTPTGVAVDSAGHAYVVGFTASEDFPTTTGAYDTSWNGNDAFVTKLDAAGASLVYSTFLGGNSADAAAMVAVDALGQAYVTGDTQSSDFPTTAGAYDVVLDGSKDAFVTKLDRTGTALVYSTLLGGTDEDSGSSITIDAAGQVYVTGETLSSDFPTTSGAYDRTHSGGSRDVFVTKLDPAGGALAYSTYLGGSSTDDPVGIVIDVSGDAHVLGLTSSTDFPVTPGALDTSLGGAIDGFVAKLDAAGAALMYSTFLGGNSHELMGGIAVDVAGDAYVMGVTFSRDFPVTPAAFDASLGGESDVFVTKLNADGATLRYSTFLGGSAQEPIYVGGIAVDGGGQAHVTGTTTSVDFPVTPGAFDTSFSGSTDVFVTKLNSTGASLAYSTFLGGGFFGSWTPRGGHLAIDESGQAYVVGVPYDDFPTTPGAYDTSHNSGSDTFVTKLDATGSSLTYSTYLGGSLTPGGDDRGLAVAVDGVGNAYVMGFTLSPDFPTTVGAPDASWNGAGDVFVTKLAADGVSLVFSTFLGGSGSDSGVAVAVDQRDNVYVAGHTNSGDFPTTAGAYDTIPTPMGDDLFVTKLDASGGELAYSTFLGGWVSPQSSRVRGIAVDSDGKVYVTGDTDVRSFPTTPGAYDRAYNGGVSDAFLTKLDAAGAFLVYSTFLGGGSTDAGTGVTVDGTGQAYVTGFTVSRNFPTTDGAFDSTYNLGSDVFVTKLDVTGATLAYSTLLGGSSGDEGRSIAVDGLGQIYATGLTRSGNFPTTAGAHDTTWNGAYDVFVTKLDAAGAALAYSTYLGGSDSDEATSVAVDHLGQAYVTGFTRSINFPTTSGAFDRSWNLNNDAFVAKLDAVGATLAYSTFLGGSNDDFGYGIAVDLAGNAYVTGYSDSPNFPTTPGVYDTRHNGSREAFVIKLGDDGPAPPTVNITANGADGPLTIDADDRLTVAFSFDAGSATVIGPSEIYIGVVAPVGRLWFDAAAQRFGTAMTPAYAGPLSSLGPVTVFDLPNVASLPSGDYWWFVSVDYDRNGAPNGGSIDVVLTTRK